MNGGLFEPCAHTAWEFFAGHSVRENIGSIFSIGNLSQVQKFSSLIDFGEYNGFAVLTASRPELRMKLRFVPTGTLMQRGT
jgi:hypothetical protein